MSGSTMFMAVSDLAAEGIGPVLDRICDWGLDGVTVSFAYHQARDLTPHSPGGLTVRVDGFHGHLSPDLFRGSLRPAELPSIDMSELFSQAGARGLKVHGWAVACHNSTLGLANPRTTIRNALDSRGAPADLCPANPEVRRYTVDLVRQVARLGVDSVAVESCHYGTFGHGYHHERAFLPLSDLDAFLMGLCFCEWCQRSIGGAAEAKQETATRLRLALADEVSVADSVTVASLTEKVGQAVADYALARSSVVTSLVQEVVTAALAEGTSLRFIDLAGAMLGYSDGLPGPASAVESDWRLGIDAQEISKTGLDAYAALLYAQGSKRVEADATSYVDSLAGNVDFRAILRPGFPDAAGKKNVQQKVQAVRSTGSECDFYHYGLYPYSTLERIAG